ncbi:MAG: M48 family metallopeptidase [Cyanobacteria bacterium P01_D01_bin.123]
MLLKQSVTIPERSCARNLGWRRALASSVAIASLVLGGVAPAASALDVGSLLFQGLRVLQLSNVSDSQDVQLGQQIHAQLMESGDVTLSQNQQLNAYVREIGQRLVQNSSRAKLPFQFFVVENKAINAFATTGGFVYINTGTIDAAETEDQIASVLAHEIAHITEKHVLENLQQSAIIRGGAQAIGVGNSNVAGAAAELALRRPKSRDAEYEADATGLGILYRSGYDPQAMPQFLTKLLKLGRNAPTIFSTHPPSSDRISRVNQLIAANSLVASSPQRPKFSGYQTQVQRLEPAEDVQTLPVLPSQSQVQTLPVLDN